MTNVEPDPQKSQIDAPNAPSRSRSLALRFPSATGRRIHTQASARFLAEAIPFEVVRRVNIPPATGVVSRGAWMLYSAILSFRREEDGSATVSLNEIAQSSSLSKTSIHRRIEELIKLKFLSIDRIGTGGGIKTTYRCRVEPSTDNAAPDMIRLRVHSRKVAPLQPPAAPAPAPVPRPSRSKKAPLDSALALPLGSKDDGTSS